MSVRLQSMLHTWRNCFPLFHAYTALLLQDSAGRKPPSGHTDMLLVRHRQPMWLRSWLAFAAYKHHISMPPKLLSDAFYVLETLENNLRRDRSFGAPI